MSTKYGHRDRSPMNSSLMWKKKLPRFLAGVCLVGTLFIFGSKLSSQPEPEIIHTTPDPAAANITLTASVGCEPDFDALERLGVTKLSQYVRQEIVAVSTPNPPLSQVLNTPLFDRHPAGKQASQDTELLWGDCTLDSPLGLEVPKLPQHVDASHFDFGVATTLDRLNESLDAFQHWAGNTGVRIFALIEPDQRVHEVEAKAERLGIQLFVTQSEEEYQTRYFSLVSHLAKNLREETRWSCIIDDDTFFLSTPALIEAFEKYDHTQQMYIGGVSESVAQIGIFGLMGFGGAGVFLSRPLVEQLAKPEVFNSCQQMVYTGDRRISLCVYQYSSAHLTIDHRLRQLDFRGDSTGFFEANRPLPLSVHHWKSWFNTDMTKLSKVSEICGDDCLLRKYRFADGWILTNGFSISKYSEEIAPDDISMELTWDGDHSASREAFMHELGPLREKDDGKVTYLLVDSAIDQGKVRQWYIRRDADRGDQIMELIWRRQ
ncbi:glycosyltransferase family 31 protein [Aspergillus stella-maris]|uniref:glycosyltransferase family 31 protein n=1 Tax=Aspergillus stella-maris TaxID=1810926 RepID=UPI003CCD64E3